VHLFQVDERVAPAGDPDRNLTHIRDSLLAHAALPAANVHAMNVEAKDLGAAAATYARELESRAGTPAVLDLVHLGLGARRPHGIAGPRRPGLDGSHRDVAPTAPYQGTPANDIDVSDPRPVALRLVRRDRRREVPRSRNCVPATPRFPPGRITGQQALIIADAAAAGTGAK
jgi:6-phosphogluconolactonase